MTAQGSTKRSRRPRFGYRTARDLDGLAGKSRTVPQIYNFGLSASIAHSRARLERRLSRPLLAMRYAPDCGRPTRGNFAAGNSGLPTVPVAIWRAGSSLGHVWHRCCVLSAGKWRARRVASDNGHPKVYADQIPSTARHLSEPRRAGKTGCQELRKRKYG